MTLVTALNPMIGYEKAAQIAKTAIASGKPNCRGGRRAGHHEPSQDEARCWWPTSYHARRFDRRNRVSQYRFQRALECPCSACQKSHDLNRSWLFC